MCSTCQLKDNKNLFLLECLVCSTKLLWLKLMRWKNYSMSESARYCCVRLCLKLRKSVFFFSFWEVTSGCWKLLVVDGLRQHLIFVYLGQVKRAPTIVGKLHICYLDSMETHDRLHRSLTAFVDLRHLVNIGQHRITPDSTGQRRLQSNSVFMRQNARLGGMFGKLFARPNSLHPLLFEYLAEERCQ